MTTISDVYTTQFVKKKKKEEESNRKHIDIT